MVYATATSKGQITIPVVIRKSLGIEAGTRVRFVPTADGCELQPVKTDSLKLMKGMFAGGGVELSIDDINQVIADSAVEAGMRGLSK